MPFTKLSEYDINNVVTMAAEYIKEGKVFYAEDDDGEERQKNLRARVMYGWSENDVRNVVGHLSPKDFYRAEPERKKSHKTYGEYLYVFHVHKLATRSGTKSGKGGKRKILLYVKIQFRNPPKEGLLIVSFHPAEREVKKRNG